MSTEDATGNGASAAEEFAAALHPELRAALDALDGLDGRDPFALQAALDAVLAAAGDDARLREFARIAAVERLRESLGSVRCAQQAVSCVFAKPAPSEGDLGRSSQPGSAIVYDDDEPAEEVQNLTLLIRDLYCFVRRRVHLDREAVFAVALWVVLSYTPRSFRRIPYLIINSPVKRCGKSTLLAVLRLLVYRPQPAANATPAVLFRLLAEYGPTLLLDEADRWIAGKNANADLIAIVNAGNEVGTPALRTVGDDHQPAAFDVFGPKAIAGIGNLPDTIVDRGIVIPMQRRPPGVQLQRITWADEEEAAALRRRLARWAQDNSKTLAMVDLDALSLPAELHDRARDNWEPLAAIASLAPQGGRIAEKTRLAAKRLAEAPADPDAIGIVLLRDVRRLFARTGRDRFLSIELSERLAKLDDEAPWATWHRHAREADQRRIQPTDLARLLRPFGVRPRQIRTANGPGKGYRWEDFADVFERYLPPEEEDDHIQPDDPDRDDED